MDKIPVGVLGATGMVGQRFIQLLEDHPWFKLTEVAASEKSAGKTYEETMKGRWRISNEIPEYARKLKVKECKPNLKSMMVFSALDSSVAGEVEEDFAKNGYIVASNSSNHRMDKDVPLLIPEINPQHLEMVKIQKKNRKWKGFIVTNPNCTAIHFNIVLKPLQDNFGLEKVMITSMQALSGAGYPGVASLDILDNVIPYIGGEEEKVEAETRKILGSLKDNEIKNAQFYVSAQCNRVNVNDGHTECVSVKLTKKTDVDEIIKSMKNFNPLRSLNLPSSPKNPIVVMKEENRPQPKLDRNVEKGMASVVGRIRKCSILDYKFVVLGHNTIRGAAGASILNAELMKVKGYLE